MIAADGSAVRPSRRRTRSVVFATMRAMGHKGIREGGPPRKPEFRPVDVVGLTVHQALIELAHEGFDADLATTHNELPRADVWLSNRVRLVVHNGLVASVVVG